MASAMTDNTASSGKRLLDEPIIHIQPPRHEDLQPSYANVLRPDHLDAGVNGWYGDMIEGLGRVLGACGAIPICIVCPNPYRPVQQGTVGLVTRFGRFARAVDPGLAKVNPLSEKLITVDVKMQIVGMCGYQVLPTTPRPNKANASPQRFPNSTP
jgi:erythrocyte band 7 integral membrane protein